ncbi:MAG: hypothetical protein AMXMBFR82_15400 [Candidatus Hydrogenedentota bacterium]
MTATTAQRRTPWLLWPLVLLWRLVTLIANATGIILALVIGAVLMFVGWILIGTIIGALIGVPLFIIGLLLFIRGLW